MALITCPECGKSISDKALSCPNCGLPAKYFQNLDNIEPKEANSFVRANSTSSNVDSDVSLEGLGNILITFDKDYIDLFNRNHYITGRDKERLTKVYGAYYKHLKNKMTFDYVCNHANTLRIDIDSLKRFLTHMHYMEKEVSTHNEAYVEERLVSDKEYFDHILDKIDTNIKLDEEQRRAVITDDDYCLLVAGAGAGKTTTMAAKVKYLVEKRGVKPDEIIVISYTNKAIGELKDRINKALGINAKVCTFHSFAFDIVKQFSTEPPEINFSSFRIIFEMLEKAIFDNKQLMRNLVLFLGYYFDLTEEVFKFENLNQYHLYKAK